MSLCLENGMLTFTADNIRTTTSSFVSSNVSDYMTTCDYVYNGYPLAVNGYPLTVNSPYLGNTYAQEKSPEAAQINKYHIKHR